jgi:ABC-type polysaccharide/polyol phosphate transport system ATPase subunit
MARIELDRVNLNFHVRQRGRIPFKEMVVRQLFRRSRNPRIEVRALQDISLKIDAGERVGIIGHNGAGKSTLLKLLAGIYPPTSGRRIVEGRISSLFEIALGFELDATGWENIAYRGYLQGETPRSIRQKMQPIADFTELGNFLNMPVRYYSAGMLVRLAFSIVTAIEPQILLVDEVLSVGDLAFQNKARQRMREMMAKADLIVMVSHDLVALSKLCERVLWMDHGRIRQVGPADEVIAAYTAHVHSNPPAAIGETGQTASAATVVPIEQPRGGSWQQRGLPPGYYDVQVTWTPDPGRAGDATFLLYDGSRLLANVWVSQRAMPIGTIVNGVSFHSLGTFPVHSGVLRVVLTPNAVCAVPEAIRILQVPPVAPVIVDNNQPGYENSPEGWITHSGMGGYGNSVSYTAEGDGSRTASWRVNDLPPGNYRVRATWTPHANRASNAPYRIYDGDELRATVRVNQQLVPVGLSVHGVMFQELAVVPVRNGCLRVVLSNDADSFVIADAIHVACESDWGPVVLNTSVPLAA